MPYRWGSLPEPLTPPWMPYAQMFEEFARELANVANAFTHDVQRIAAWAIVSAPLSDQRKMGVAHEFVDALATNAVNAPYAIRSRFIFATAHLCHQANRSRHPDWVDDLPLDHEIHMDAADRCGTPWRRYNKLKLCVEAIGGRSFRADTNDFRNAYNHRFSPRFMFGITNLVTRHVDPVTRAVSYGFRRHTRARAASCRRGPHPRTGLHLQRLRSLPGARSRTRGRHSSMLTLTIAAHSCGLRVIRVPDTFSLGRASFDVRHPHPNSRRTPRMERISDNLSIDLAVRLANTRAVWISTMRFLVDRGVLTEADMAEMRDCCLDASTEFAITGNGLKREFGLAGVRDMNALFKSVLRVRQA